MKLFIVAIVDVGRVGMNTNEVTTFYTRPQAVNYCREVIRERLKEDVWVNNDEERLRIIEELDGRFSDTAINTKASIYEEQEFGVLIGSSYSYLSDELYLDVFEKDIDTAGEDVNKVFADNIQALLMRVFKNNNKCGKEIDTTFIHNYRDGRGDNFFIDDFFRYNGNAEEMADEIFSDEVLHYDYSLFDKNPDGTSVDDDRFEYIRDEVASLSVDELIQLYVGDRELRNFFTNSFAENYKHSFGKPLYKALKYKWSVRCDDAPDHIMKSSPLFDTEKECYENMREEALEKMKWNTEYDEDFPDDTPIGYEVSFYKNKITHTSYSGTYTYEIENS